MKFHFHKFLLLIPVGFCAIVFTMDQPRSNPILTELDKDLLAAITSNDVAEVKRLLDKKANPNVQYAGQGVPFNVMFQTPLIAAISRNASSEIIKLLLKAGANPNLSDGMHSLPPIIWASRLGNGQAVKLLIDAGVNHDNFFHYSLVYALQGGNSKIIKMLVNKGASINPELKGKKTLLMLLFAVDLGINENDRLIEMMKVLLAQGLDINAQDDTGWTALMLAVQKNNAEAVRFLLEQGANQNLRNKDKKTALDLAREQNSPEVIALLENPPAHKSLIRKKL